MFIKTSFEDMAELLRKENYVELPKEGNFWVFINSGSLKFSEEEQKEKQIVYTDKLCI